MNLLKYVTYAFRNIAGAKGNSALIVVIMAIGLGISITMFSFAKGILWNRIDIDPEDTLAHVSWIPINNQGRSIHVHDYMAIRDGNQSFAKMAAFFFDSPSFNYPAGGGIVKTYDSAAVTPNFFNVIQQRPLHGRLFMPDDVAAGAERAIIISHEVWHEQFNGEQKAFEAAITCNGIPSRVVGIMPAGFAFPGSTQVWWATEFDWLKERDRGTGLAMQVIGKLKPGIAYEQAELDINRIASQLAQEFPQSNKDKTRVEVMSFRKNMHGQFLQRMLLALLAGGALVLLVTCANVSNLMMAHSARKSFELATRNALGASKLHIVSHVMVGGFILIGLGMIGGLVIADFGTIYIWQILGNFSLPYWWNVEVDTATVITALVAMLLAGVVAMLLPVMQATRKDSYELLRDDSRTSTGVAFGALSRILVGFQITIATTLMIAALFNYITQANQNKRDFSYDMDEIVSALVWFNRSAGFQEEESVFAYRRNLEQRLKSQGAASVSLTSGETLGLYGANRSFEIAGESYDRIEDKPTSRTLSVTTEYFDTYELGPVESGRLLSLRDTKDSKPVAVVNRAFVEAYFPGKNPVGMEIRIHEPGGQMSDWTTIVGVCQNVVNDPAPGESISDIAFIYRPLRQSFQRGLQIIARADSNGHQLITPFAKAMTDLNPDMPSKRDIRTNTDNREFYDLFPNLLVKLFGAFGIASFVVAGIGLYGVVSFSTAQRTREFGVRMALGALRGDILKSVAKKGALETIIGLLLGSAAGYAVILLLNSFFNNGSMASPVSTYLIVIPLILLALIIAMLNPVLRALRLDPNKALRHV